MNLSSKHEIWIYFDTSFGYIPLSIYISPSKSIQSATHQSHFVIHVAYEQIDHLISLMLRFASGNLSTPAVEKHNIFLVYPQFPHHTHSCSVFIYLFDWIRIILPCRGKKKRRRKLSINNIVQSQCVTSNAWPLLAERVRPRRATGMGICFNKNGKNERARDDDGWGRDTHRSQAETHVYMYTGPTWAREDENTLSIKFVRNELIFARVCVECDRRTEKKCLKKKHRYVTCIRTNVTMERYNFAHCYSIHMQCYCQLSQYRK